MPIPSQSALGGARAGTQLHEELAREALSYADALYRLAWRLSGSAAEAEDLVQETYARALGAAGSYAPDSNLRAWLCRILRNVFIDQVRRRQRERPWVEHHEPEGDPPEQELLRDDRELDRLRGVVAGEIEAALQTLPEAWRALILLDLDGFSTEEMAQAMDCAAGTVKSRLFRARVALRERLQHYARSEE